MVVFGSLASQFAEGFGLAAAAIAVCGFLTHVPSAITGADEASLHRATVVGGLIGFSIAAFVVVLSVSGVG